MSKKKDDESSPKSTKKITKPKNPNRVNSPYNLAKSAACKKLREEHIEQARNPSRGRPTTYDQEMANYIIDRVASTSCGLKTLCETDPRFPSQETVNLWRWKHPDFSERYLAAKQVQAHLLAEDCEEVAKEERYFKDQNGAEKMDPAFIASRRLIIDTKKWHAGKVAPAFYGDRKVVDEIKTDHDSMKSELMSIRAELDEKNKKDY